MTTSLEIWHKNAEPFSALVSRTTDWDAHTPCEGWTARDLVEHVVTTERDFLEQHGLAGPAADTADPGKQWLEHERRVAELLADPAVADREFAGYFGPSTIGETLAGFYGGDLIVHRWDLATSQGLDAGLSEEDLAAVDAAMDGFGEQAYAPGLFAPPVPVPDDAEPLRRVLARTGRRV